MPTKLPSFDLVKYFIESHRLPLELAKTILRNEQDCMDFQNLFYETNRQVVEDLLDYREYKIAKANVTVGEFLRRCYDCNGLMRDVFEEVFVQAFNEADMSMILTALFKKETSLEELFLNFLDNPNKNILQYVI